MYENSSQSPPPAHTKKKKKIVKRLLTHSCSWDFFFMVAKYLLQL